jgi:hypothetical protein
MNIRALLKIWEQKWERRALCGEHLRNAGSARRASWYWASPISSRWIGRCWCLRAHKSVSKRSSATIRMCSTGL